jgi:plasmid stabilization system protein ParE
VKVRWTRPALDRLKAHRVWLDSLENANTERIIRAIRRATQVLERLGDIGRPSQITGHRELSVHHVPYVIIYRVEGETIIIATVFHTSQDRP